MAPFLINYSGALFREYPGPWQVLLRQDNAMYACVAEREERYNLGEVKKQLMQSMGLDTEEVGSALAFLRTGYKVSSMEGHYLVGELRVVCALQACVLSNTWTVS